MEGTDCSAHALTSFDESLSSQIWRVNALIVVNAVFVGVLVGIGAYGRRYRHRPLTRYLFQGATLLFLPVISNVVSTIANQYIISFPFDGEIIITGLCTPRGHIFLVFIWTGLVQIVGINTSAVVAADAREDRTTAPPVILLVYAVWTCVLAVYTAGRAEYLRGFNLPKFLKNVYSPRGLILLLLFALIFVKTIFKYYAFYKAKRSFALGRNPRLIVGYMEQLQDGGSQHAELAGEHIPPPLLVMAEDTVQVERQPHGCRFRWMSDQGGTTRMNSNYLVTVDKFWHLDDLVLRSTPHIKDLCFSFALFKLLRCRFARYTVSEANFTKVHNFFWHVLLKDRNDERVLGVIADELSFLNDYYYSSLPISYSKCHLAVLSIFISLLSIVYSSILFSLLSIGYLFVVVAERTSAVLPTRIWQIRCKVVCRGKPVHTKGYGSLLFDLVPVFLLLALVMLAEVRDIASYICSNWTKVAMICRYVNHASWQQSPAVQKWVVRVLRCKCNLIKHWEDNMNQCSILVFHPRKTPMALLRRLFPCLPEEKKNVKVPREVKTAVMDALRSSEGRQSNGITSLRHGVQIGDDILWACSGKGTTDTLLVWHIATSIVEVRYPSSASDHKTIDTHLSGYCAYLMTYSPELLPDDDKWSRSLYKAVKKDAERVLAGGARLSTPEEKYQRLVELLTAGSKHEVLKDGARLGKQLAELVEGEETAWKVLAGFWLEMILYVAPSDNLDGHADAIARGGELITLLWALLAHVGIVSRPSTNAAATAASSAVA